MRGQQSIYSDVFPPSIEVIPEPKANQGNLRNERDIAMACRYYYHAQIKRRRYDDCLMYLEIEFYLTATSIVGRLNESQKYIKELVSNKTTVSSLKERYPFFTW